jgi:DNA-binding transcriptional LysR family regulator
MRSTIPIKNALGVRELRAVLAVAEEGSFRKAAARLGYTQSALSHQVAAAEAALGRPAFHRPGGRGHIRLTPAGEVVWRRARRALSEIEAIIADAERAERNESIRVRVGVSQTAAAEIMPAVLRDFRREYPGVEVVLSELEDSAAIAGALANGRLDLSFAINPEPDERMVAVALVDDPWVILSRRDSGLAEADHPGFEILDGTDLVAWTRRWPGQVELEAAWQREGIAPRIVYRTDDNLALQRLVAAGLGHACIGRLAARGAIDPSLTWLPLREVVVSRHIALCYPRLREPPATARALMAAVQAQTAALASR